jgi:hypothetical protein
MINCIAAKYDMYIGYSILLQLLDLHLLTHVYQHTPYKAFHMVRFQISFLYRPQ